MSGERIVAGRAEQVGEIELRGLVKSFRGPHGPIESVRLHRRDTGRL